MAKHREKQRSENRAASRKGRKRRGRGLLIVVLLFLVLVVFCVVLFRSESLLDALAGEQTQSDNAVNPAESLSAGEVDTGLKFPYTVGDTGLEVNSLLSSDVMNPDAGNELVENLASLEITNVSDQYLVSAVFSVTLDDGTVYSFRVQDLPADGRTIAFAVDNAVYENAVPCEAIEAETEFAAGEQRMEDSIAVSVEGTAITLTNLTREDLGPLNVICHDTLDESEFFGGVSYVYPTEGIPAGGSVTVDAIDCMVGQPAVVRITPEN